MSRFDDIAAALAGANWENVSIGNKGIILAAIDALGIASRRDYELRSGLHVARGALLGIGTDYSKEVAEHLAGVIDPALASDNRDAN